jgi:hypothetical protein
LRFPDRLSGLSSASAGQEALRAMIEQDAKKLLAASGAPLYGTVVAGVTPASRSAFRGGRINVARSRPECTGKPRRSRAWPMATCSKRLLRQTPAGFGSTSGRFYGCRQIRTANKAPQTRRTGKEDNSNNLRHTRPGIPVVVRL